MKAMEREGKEEEETILMHYADGSAGALKCLVVLIKLSIGPIAKGSLRRKRMESALCLSLCQRMCCLC